MTLVKLRKTVEHYRELVSSTQSLQTQQFELLRGLPFYSGWLPNQKIVRDFNHAIGLPQKNGQSYPLFDYEQMLYDTLQKHKYIWCKKATGLGVTEFMLRYMAWLCFHRISSDNQLETSAKSLAISGSQMCIVTGPRIELAITLIDRMKDFFKKKSQIF